MVKSIWQASNDEYMLQPLTDEIIKKAEELFNVTLPNSYIAILKQQNGGQPICNAHPSPVPTVWGETFVIVEHIKGIGAGNGILENDYYIKEWELPEGLILFNGDGHTWLAFDYRNATSEPPIVYVDVDLEQIIQIADSFEEFLKKLYLENEEFDFEGMEVKVYSKQDLEKFIQEDNVDELIRAIPDRVMKRISEAANVTPIRFHDIRHTHASVLISEGVDIVKVQTRLGHSKPSITLEHYAHMMPNQDDEVADIFHNALQKSR
ncbi:SMI1/KNR4 family protein [Peribacillus butanolivorans]|uniref:SMI1/KNR4 family protein n=1 Tax=Peribacillus butanolivorans TaxID=421767 RepID=UPI003676E29D